MTYDDVVSAVVRAVEAAGAAIMILGGLSAFARYGSSALRPATREHSYERLRRNLGRVILLGLEVLIVADIIRTIVVEPSLTSVGVLGIIVIIRILLSFSLEVEIDGAWPWSRWRTRAASAPAGASPPADPKPA